MKKPFRQFYRERTELPGQKPLGDLGSPNEPDERLMRIARFAVVNHLDDILSLFSQLAHKDNDIRAELENYNKSQGKVGDDAKLAHWRSEPDKDQVVPSSADGFGPES